MEKRLSHIPFTSVRVDDILVSGRSDAEHLSNLKAVLQVTEDCGLRLKHSKCVFMTPEVTYLGFRVNKEGTTPVDDNIAAVMNAPEPVNASQLKSCWNAKLLPSTSSKFSSYIRALICAFV